MNIMILLFNTPIKLILLFVIFNWWVMFYQYPKYIEFRVNLSKRIIYLLDHYELTDKQCKILLELIKRTEESNCFGYIFNLIPFSEEFILTEEELNILNYGKNIN